LPFFYHITRFGVRKAKSQESVRGGASGTGLEYSRAYSAEAGSNGERASLSTYEFC
jgi:hypothetical protein